MANAQRPTLSVQKQNNGLVVPALQFGAFTGFGGLLFGGTAGIIRSSPPVLFAIASGLQCGALGSTYWLSRSVILRAWTTPTTPLTSRDRMSASAIAGGIAGSGVALLTRGPRNVIPGGIMFSLFGYGGQFMYDFLDEQPDADAERKEGFWRWLGRQKWSPVSVLSDGEYETMLREKMLKVEVEIALIDDRITELRKQEAVGDERKIEVAGNREGPKPTV